MMELLIASHNVGKITEFRDLLTPLGFTISSAADYRLIEPAETGTTFEENATIKARAAMMATGLASLSDDSGLCVPALNDEPGVYTADWAGHPRNWMDAMTKVHEKLGDNPDRRAFFVCVLALCRPDNNIEYFRGEVWGNLYWPPRGKDGFGFDPMFIPDGFNQTFAEMAKKDKNKISHRAKAIEKFMASL